MLRNTSFVAPLLRSCSHANDVRLFSKIGFVGLGNMGGHMARNLLKKGYDLTVYDLNKAATSSLIEIGAKSAANAAEVSPNAEVIVSMLPSNDNVVDCYTGTNGILSTVKRDTLLIDSSSIDPSVSQALSREAEKYNARFIDAPVSGGINSAKNGSLTFMVGGSKRNFDIAKPVLEAMGSKIVHCGEVGSGEAAKLCNNMLLAISMIGTAEAFILGERLGLSPKTLANIINCSSGRCWSSELYNPVPGILDNVPSCNDYEGGFGTALITKDLGLAQSAANRTGVPILLGTLAHEIYKTANTRGLSHKDFSVIYQFLKVKS